MSTPNNELTPNQPTQTIPAPSAQGNTTPSANGSQETQSATVQTPPPAQTPSAPVQAVTPAQTPSATPAPAATPIRYESLSPELRAFVDSVCAAARRDGDGAGYNRGRAELQGSFDAERARATSAEAERDSFRLQLWQIRAAVRAGVQDPLTFAPVLNGENEDAMLAQAQGIMQALGAQLPRPLTPPVTPAGGDLPPASSATTSTTAPAAGGSTGVTPAAPAALPNKEQLKQAQRNSGGYDAV